MNFSKFKSRAMDAAKKAVAKKSSSSYVGQRDAGAIAAKKMRDKEQQKYVGFLPANEGMSYGLYKGSGEPSGQMAAFAKKGSGAMPPFPKKDNERKGSGAMPSPAKKKEVKKEGLFMMILGKEVELKEKCWKGYEKKGMKTMFGKRYPNCVKKEEVEITDESYNISPADAAAARRTENEIAARERAAAKRRKDRNQLRKQGQFGASGKYYVTKRMEKEEVEIEEKKMVKVKLNPEKKIGVKVTDIGPGGKEVVRKNTMDEGAEVVTEVKDKKGKGSGTKDACYHKVKSRYSVWPSAYASGALVKCRKVGAANWGNSSKKESFSDWRSEFIWEDGDSAKKLSEDDMKGMSVKSGHKRPTKSGAGMTQKGVEAYRRRNPGSKLKTAVTTKPSKLKKGSKAANRRKSYCARSAGQMKKFPKAAKDPNSRLRQARRRWKC